MSGRTITIYVSVGPGGAYDAYGRMLANAIPKHIPGKPTVVVSNMPGGGGRNLSNYMYGVAPKDGTAIAIVQHTTVYDAAFGEKGVNYEPAKLNWLGSLATTTFVSLAWSETGIKSVSDLKTRELSVGATGPGATSFQYPTLMNSLFGTRYKVIIGYKGSGEIYKAVEQRELDGTGGLAWEIFRNTRGHWLKENKVNILVQFGLKRHKELPTVPLVLDLAQNEDDKRTLQFVFSGLQFAMPFMVPPGIAPDRLAMLRSALTAAAADPELLAEAKKRRLEISPTDGATVQRIVTEIGAAPNDLKMRARRALTGK